jgi:hypothetical protein
MITIDTIKASSYGATALKQHCLLREDGKWVIPEGQLLVAKVGFVNIIFEVLADSLIQTDNSIIWYRPGSSISLSKSAASPLVKFFSARSCRFPLAKEVQWHDNSNVV